MQHAFSPSTQEAEAGGALWVQGQPGLQSEFQDSLAYTEKPWLKKPKKKKKFHLTSLVFHLEDFTL